MRITLFLVVLLAGSALASQTVWKWVDEKGVTHYSDRAVPGATKLELHGNSKSNDSAEPPPVPSADTSDTDAAAPTRYSDFTIFQPADGETLANTGGSVIVGLRLEPGLRAEHSIVLYMDGRLVEGFRGDALSYELNAIPRGTHTLIAVINDSQTNRRVQETDLVTFVVRQASIAQPPVGPSMSPPPKPRPSGSANKLPTSQPSYATLNGSMPKIDPKTNRPVPKN